MAERNTHNQRTDEIMETPPAWIKPQNISYLNEPVNEEEELEEEEDTEGE
jgi:hypothetical protein